MTTTATETTAARAPNTGPALVGSVLANAIIARLVREQPSCETCPRCHHVRLVVVAEVIKANRPNSTGERPLPAKGNA